MNMKIYTDMDTVIYTDTYTDTDTDANVDTRSKADVDTGADNDNDRAWGTKGKDEPESNFTKKKEVKFCSGGILRITILRNKHQLGVKTPCYCLWRKIYTLRIVKYREPMTLRMIYCGKLLLKLLQKTRSHRCRRRVDDPLIIYDAESWLLASYIMGNNFCWYI